MKKIIRAVALAGLVASPALVLAGDNCGNNDRAPLPDCVASTASPFTITNNCSYKVTVKIARASANGSRVDIAQGATVSNERPGTLFCCPRYNRHWFTPILTS